MKGDEGHAKRAGERKANIYIFTYTYIKREREKERESEIESSGRVRGRRVEDRWLVPGSLTVRGSPISVKLSSVQGAGRIEYATLLSAAAATQMSSEPVCV